MNSIADALSRMPGLKPPEYEEKRPTTLLNPDQFISALTTNPPVLEVNEYIQPLTDGQLITRISENTLHLDPVGWEPSHELNDELVLVSTNTGRIWVPPLEELCREVVRAHHDSKIAGHLGTSGTLELVTRKYWWKEIAAFMKHYVQGCFSCARNKVRNQKPAGLLQPLLNPEGPWLWTQSDFITQLPPLRGFDAIYVIADRLTKMAHFIPCHTTCTTEQLAELHIRHVWLLHGLPLQHNSDRGPQFMAPYTHNLHWALGVDQQLSTAYHPESQGQVESNNKWLETYLCIFSAYQQDDWADFLHTAEFAYNNHHHPSISMTPFYANYGYHLVYTDRAGPDQMLEAPMRIQHIHEVQAHCQLAIEKAQQVYKCYADRHCQNLSFTVRDCAWLESYNLSMDAPSKKLATRRLGPYKVQKLVGPSSYQLDIPATWRIHNVFHAGLLSRTRDDTIVGRISEPAPIVCLQDKELWVIDQFINSRWFHGKFQLKVRWEDQAEEQDDWQDYFAILAEAAQWRDELQLQGQEDDDSVGPLVEEYYLRHPGAPRHDDAPHQRAPPPRH
jgi:hypothetical protein